MNTYCYYNGAVRVETDATVIDTICRKGGKVISAPPNYNAATQHAPVYDGTQWVWLI